MKIPNVGSAEVGNKLVNVRIRNRQPISCQERSYEYKTPLVRSRAPTSLFAVQARYLRAMQGLRRNIAVRYGGVNQNAGRCQSSLEMSPLLPH